MIQASLWQCENRQSARSTVGGLCVRLLYFLRGKIFDYLVHAFKSCGNIGTSVLIAGETGLHSMVRRDTLGDYFAV